MRRPEPRFELVLTPESTLAEAREQLSEDDAIRRVEMPDGSVLVVGLVPAAQAMFLFGDDDEDDDPLLAADVPLSD